MAKYKEKLAEVEAVQFEALKDVKPDTKWQGFPVSVDTIGAHAWTGTQIIRPGDWLVIDGNGKALVYSNAQFELLYEVVKGGK